METQYYAHIDNQSYSDLREWSKSYVTTSPEDEEGFEVIGPLTESDADLAVKAQNRSCEAAWTPNQSPEQREKSLAAIKFWSGIIDLLVKHAKLVGASQSLIASGSFKYFKEIVRALD